MQLILQRPLAKDAACTGQAHADAFTHVCVCVMLLKARSLRGPLRFYRRRLRADSSEPANICPTFCLRMYRTFGFRGDVSARAAIFHLLTFEARKMPFFEERGKQAVNIFSKMQKMARAFSRGDMQLYSMQKQ